ncbi:DUF3253 domain-containing protein [Salinisphaera sp. T31B1]|uniref:DUF3253 domain-containing protein n=1 Tax=Salinisphaera sp. T31B1 TaxID=727963 RepID=UPI00333FD49F
MNTPRAEEETALAPSLYRRIETAILAAVAERGSGKTVCPSEVARALAAPKEASDAWRDLMPAVRAVAADLCADGRLTVTQRGEPVDARRVRGPIRLGRPPG